MIHFSWLLVAFVIGAWYGLVLGWLMTKDVEGNLFLKGRMTMKKFFAKVKAWADRNWVNWYIYSFTLMLIVGLAACGIYKLLDIWFTRGM